MHWVKSKRSNVTLWDVLRFTFLPPFAFLGKRKCTRIEKEGLFYKADFKGFPSSIFWPINFPMSTLYQVAAELLYKNWWNYEIDENPIHSDDCVIDCGAAEGAFSLQVVSKCKKVYAIEPHPAFVSAMKKTFKNLSNIELLPIAVGENKGLIRLSDGGIMSKVNSDSGIDVEMETIDNLFFHKKIKVDYIKADLEGYELKMLVGAELTIKNCKPKLSICTYHYKDDFKNTYEYLKEVCPDYTIKGVGITAEYGTPVMLHAWIK